MALVLADRVRETTTTTGTGTITLGGAVGNFETFTSNLSDGDTTYYAIVDANNSDFEVGLGTFASSGTTLARTTVIASSNSNSAVSLSSGTKDVFITLPASKMIFQDASGNVTIPGDLTVSGDDITMGTNTSGNLLIADGTNFNSIAVGSLSEISTVANDDVLLAVDTSGGGLKKITRSTVVSGLAASGAISNVVEDTTPQLGGNLDTNSHSILLDDAHFIGDENGNEQIIFQTTSSAVNQFDVTNAATGNAPELSATGDDTNISLKITPKGSGQVLLDGNVGVESGLIDLKNSGSRSQIKFYCESGNAHAQALQAAPHSESASNTLTLPSSGGNADLVSVSSTATLTNKTLTTPIIAEIDSSSTITLDAASNIILDSDSGVILLEDATTTWLQINRATNDVEFFSAISDGDIVFKGNDGGSSFTALTLDMSEAGAATFNSSVTATSVTANGGLVADNITIDGTEIDLSSGDLTVDVAGDIVLDADGGDIFFKDGGTTFGSATNTSGNLIIKSGTTTALTFDGANITVAGNLTVSGTTTQVNTVTMNAQNAVVFEGATADDHETTLTIVDPTADRTINLPNQSGTLPVLAAVSTTQITSTPEELNILDGVTSTATELNILDGVTATTAELNYSDTGAAVGTVVASKVVTADANKDVASFRNITLTGELDAGSLDVSGDADIDGTLEADAITVNGTALATVIADEATALAIALG